MILICYQNFDSVSKDRVRSLGRIRLCGTLHVCWQNKNKVDGQYLICLLYHDFLCLAYAGKVDPIYILKACISLHEITVEKADNGRGKRVKLTSNINTWTVLTRILL